ncbi:MAG: cyclic nucleotide-binding domain-containing protein [Chitinispirillaceae bacterium]|nr:cyclic nucleotide-binding domain-containing protein [Chitinispirillaceae bacterium]
MTMMQPSRNELKTGKRPVRQQYRSFKAGETLFTEGSTGRELFIIQEGRVGIYKDTPDGRVELARVEEGGIIGEMSLLDTLPRSATVVALDRIKTVVVGYAQFQSVMQTIPVWLQSIIKIVVSRLRDANRRVDQSVLRNKERGLVALIKLLFPVFRREIGSIGALPRDTVLIEAYYVCRLRKKETEQLLGNLEKRSIITSLENGGVCCIGIPDKEVLNLFEEYLKLKDLHQTFKEVAIPAEAINVLSNIVYIAQKLGRETDEGTLLLKSALVEDLSSKDSGQLDKRLLDLRRRNLVNLLPSENDTAIIFHKETLGRIKKIQEWIPRFSLELK